MIGLLGCNCILRQGKSVQNIENKIYEKIQHENTNKNKVGTAVLISDKVDFKEIYITRKLKEHFMIKYSVFQLNPF